ncbi:MAG: hypothetical protein BM555_00460 [Crocinitomix sp. MedPE-SWsnd]|nr:MAG: hypothetical protein BM555_00460 [Crocinitomix sp. MedPE-SWsnd]
MKSLIYTLITLVSISSFSQKETLALDIKVRDDDQKNVFLENARVRVIQEGKVISEALSDSTGTIDKIVIPMQGFYAIKVDKEGYALKFGTITTSSANTRYASGTIKFPMVVGLVKPTEREDYTFLSEQPMIEFYIDSLGEQAWDDDYTSKMLEKVVKCQEGWTIEEVENYVAPRNEGITLLEDGNFDEAREAFKKAQEFNDNPEIKTALKDCDIAQTMTESNQIFYDKYIQIADQLLDNKRYEEARGYFELASGVMPYEVYPKEKMAQCEAIVSSGSE